MQVSYAEQEDSIRAYYKAALEGRREMRRCAGLQHARMRRSTYLMYALANTVSAVCDCSQHPRVTDVDLLQLMVARLPTTAGSSRLDDVIIGFICFYLEGERPVDWLRLRTYRHALPRHEYERCGVATHRERIR